MRSLCPALSISEWWVANALVVNHAHHLSSFIFLYIFMDLKRHAKHQATRRPYMHKANQFSWWLLWEIFEIMKWHCLLFLSKWKNRLFHRNHWRLWTSRKRFVNVKGVWEQWPRTNTCRQTWHVDILRAVMMHRGPLVVSSTFLVKSIDGWLHFKCERRYRSRPDYNGQTSDHSS